MIFKRQKEAARNVKTYVNDVVNGIATLHACNEGYEYIYHHPVSSWTSLTTIIITLFWLFFTVLLGDGWSPAIVKKSYARIMNFGSRFRLKRPFIYLLNKTWTFFYSFIRYSNIVYMVYRRFRGLFTIGLEAVLVISDKFGFDSRATREKILIKGFWFFE